MADLPTKYGLLKDEFGKTNVPPDRIGRLLGDLKLLMLNSPFLTAVDASMDVADRVIYRDILELDAIFSIKTNNIKEFARVCRQLISVYSRATPDIPQSDQMGFVLALYLVYLLTENSFNEYNVQYALAKRSIASSEYLDYAAKLAAAIFDSSFTSIFELQQNVPSPLFERFAAALLDRARASHAKSIEQVYGKIALGELATILHFATKEETTEFVRTIGWTVEADGETIQFPKIEEKRRSAVDRAARSIDLAVVVSGLQ